MVQPPDRVLVPIQKNIHNNVFEFFYRTRAPTQVKMVTSDWTQDSWNTALLPHHQSNEKGHKPYNPHPKCCLLFPGTRDDHPVRSPVWSISSPRGANSFKLNCCYYKGFRQKTPWLRSGRETSALLDRPIPMHRRKMLQKKETSTRIPKKHLEYEVSQGEIVMGSTLIETAHPGQAP